MAVRLKDLSPAARAQVDAQLGTHDRRATNQTKDNLGPGLPIRCHGCGQVFAVYQGKRGWEGHAQETGHHRADIIFGHATARDPGHG